MRLRPNPSRRVNSATVTTANSERQNVNSYGESVVSFMKSPPVLHTIAAPSMNRSGETPPRKDNSDLLCPVNFYEVSVSDFLVRRFFFARAPILLAEVFTELSVPGRDDD